jgi:hypothetical protein
LFVPTSKARTLILRSANAGFFSNFNSVLNNLHYQLGCDGIGAIVVDWRADPEMTQFTYGHSDDGNVWLHYFEPLPFDSFPAETVDVRSYAHLSMTGGRAYAMYKMDRRWRRIYHDLFRQYISIKTAISERVEAIYRAGMSGHHCIGVHYRHPRHAVETPNRMPTVDTFIDRVRQLLPENEPWSVFLATDVEPAVAAFRAAFGDRLILQPGVTRAAQLTDDHLHHGNQTSSTVPGEHVLIDCLLLARCDVLLHVTSNVATAAGYINPNLKMVYCETDWQAVVNYIRYLLRAPGLHTKRSLERRRRR